MKAKNLFSNHKFFEKKINDIRFFLLEKSILIKNLSLYRILKTNSLYFLRIPFLIASSAFVLNYYKKRTIFSGIEFKKFYLVPNNKKIEDFKDGEMAEFLFGDSEKRRILVISKNGNLYAFDNDCPYQSTNLNRGIVINNKIKCPVHGDSFDLFSGKNIVGPSIDDLKKYELKKDIENKYYIEVEKFSKNRKNGKIYKRDLQEKEKFVIIGGGIAALSCAKSLRDNGFKGEITIISEEKYLPYNRPLLSKNLNLDINKLLLKDESFYRDYDINVQLNTEVILLNEKSKEIKLSNGNIKSFDKILFCTGSTPKIPMIDGRNLSNVFTLKNYEDLKDIKSAAAKANKIVFIGSNITGLELASVLKRYNRNLEIFIVDSKEAPFENILGKEVGDILRKLHEKNGIKFKLEHKLISIVEMDKEKKIKKLTLENIKNKEIVDINNKKNDNKSSQIYADMIIFSNESSPNINILQSLVTIENEKIKCDATLKSSDPNIYSAGDVCSYPNIVTGQRVNFSYYVNAMMQGRIVAMNMMGENKIYNTLPFFWSTQYEKNLHFIGYFNKYDDIIINQPDVDNPFKFEAYYFKFGRLLGFCAMDSPNSANIIYEAFKNNLLITPDSIRRYGMNLDSLKKQINQLEIYNEILEEVHLNSKQ